MLQQLFESQAVFDNLNDVKRSNVILREDNIEHFSLALQHVFYKRQDLMYK